MILCDVCLLSADATLGLDDEEWMIGIGVDGHRLVWVGNIDGLEYTVEHLHNDLAKMKDSVEAQNSSGQLRMRYS